MVRKATELVKAKGILSTPNPKPGKMLKDDTVKLVNFMMMMKLEVCQGKTILCL
jgi:hypothetical protein